MSLLAVAPTAPSVALDPDRVRPAASLGQREVSCDVLVVGTGAGGAVAGTEQARRGRKVLFLEAGGAFAPRRDFHRRKLSWSTAHLYAGRGVQLALGDPPILIPQGRCVGGSTVLNSAICFRPPAERLDEWAELVGDERLRPDALQPFVDEIWQRAGVTKTHLGIGRRNNDMLRLALERAGAPVHDWMDRNAPGCLGCGICHFGCPSGGKASVDKAILPEALNLGAEVLTRAEVVGLILEGGRVTGAEAKLMDPATDTPVGDLRVRADRVIVAGSATSSPRLLARSGLGGPECGRHLAVHPGIAALAEFEEPVVMWDGVPQGYWGKHPDVPTVTFETANIGVAELHAMLGSAGAEGAQEALRYPHLALAGAMLRDVGEGTVEDGGGGRPAMRYSLFPEDVAAFKTALKFLVHGYFAAGARSVAPFVNPQRFYTNEQEALDAIDRVQEPSDFSRVHASHPHGTCRMGPVSGPNAGVVDGDGKVHGVDGIYVMDGSVFPSTLGVNPQITIMAVCLALARRLD